MNREAWKLVWRLVRTSRVDPIRFGSKPSHWKRLLLEWIVWVPQVLEMVDGWEAEELADFEMPRYPEAPLRGESKTGLKKRQQAWRGERRALVREWKKDIVERLVGYRIMKKFSGWWLAEADKRTGLASAWNSCWKAQAILGWREAQRYFVHDQDLANARCKWASKGEGRWKKYGDMPAARKYWPPSVQLNYAETVAEAARCEANKGKWNRGETPPKE